MYPRVHERCWATVVFLKTVKTNHAKRSFSSAQRGDNLTTKTHTQMTVEIQ